MKRIIILLLILIFLLPIVSHAAIPHLINYQGKLTDSTGNPITGTRNITFRIYEQEAGASAVWSETQNSITVDKGIFSVLLGGVTALNLSFDKPYWLSIQVESDPEMTPRQRITSSGYAFRAENADTAQNAAKVNNIEASTTAAANKLLPLDANAKVPLSVLGLKTYDSGWFEIKAANSYIKTHNLGTTKAIVLVYSAADNTGSQMQLEAGDASGSNGIQIYNISTTQITIYPQSSGFNMVAGIRAPINSGYARIIMLALE